MNMTAPAESHHQEAVGTLDRMGMTGALLCAIHCALLPVALVVLPSVGLALVFNDRVEFIFVGFASFVGLVSLVRSFRMHRAGAALALLVPGLALLWGGVLWAPLHEALAPHAITMAAGGSLVAVAHFLNARLVRRACT